MDTARVAPENAAPLLRCRIFLKGDFKGGHAMKEFTRATNIMDKRFGRLVVLRPAYRNKQRLIVWLCKCDCGNEKLIDGSSLRRGLTRSCGCYNRESASIRNKNNIVHGHTVGGEVSPTYQAWANMISRCTNKNNDRYASYGDRGISVCDKWLSFAGFLDDMGEKPEGLTLERINNDGNYDKSNCKWASWDEQRNNMQQSRWLEFNGERLTLTQWANRLGIGPSALHRRLRLWSFDKAMSTPSMRKN